MRMQTSLVILCSLGMIAARTSAAAPAADVAARLAAREAELLDRYRDLERSLLRLADVLDATDPRRAAALRTAFDRARDEQVGDRVATVVRLLEEGQLLKAGSGQDDVLRALRGLLELVETGAAERRVADTKREVREFLGRVGKLIAKQRDIEGSTEAGDEAGRLADRQRATAEEARGLADDIDGFARRLADEGDAGGEAQAAPAGGAAGEDSGEEGAAPQGGSQPEGSGGTPAAGPPEGGGGESPKAAEPGADAERGEEGAEAAEDADTGRARRTRQRLEAAEQRMRRAREQLDESRRSEARREQEKALEELETARAELEEILRQLREEEVEQLLVNLEARLRGMLRTEREVLSGVEKTTGSTAAGRERQLEAARLGREQAGVTAEASKALLLVRDDGSAVAIPQALEQVRDDSAQVASRLDRGDVGAETLGLVADIVTGLEEMLAAVERARQQAEEEQPQAPGMGRPPQPGKEPLVDALAELKMLRTLQSRVNARTRRLSQVLDDAVDSAAAPELRAVLGRLAERQRAIERAARDIVKGVTE
ncbi:MAG: hypothetical protein ACKOC8_12980 [Pirellulales bacterium]